MEKEVEDRFDELEGQLLAQEHRLLAIARNVLGLFVGNSKRSEKCRVGIWWSLWSFVFGSFVPNSAAGTSFLATAITLFALNLQCNQIKIAKEQNKLIAEQNNIAEAAKFSSRILDLQSELLKLPANQRVPNDLEIESILWSQTLVPLNRDPASGQVLSRERGRLLSALIQSPADTSIVIAKGNFSYSDLKDARFQVDSPKLFDAVLLGARLDGGDFSNADFTEAYLLKATLIGSILKGAILTDADATEADFTDCDLRGADLRDTIIADANFTLAKLEGAIVDDDQWFELQRKSSNPPKGLIWSAWKIERDENGLFRLKSTK